MLGGWLVTQPGWGIAGVALATMAISAAGIALSRWIPLAPAADPALRINWNPVTETWRNFAFTRENRTVFLSILGISWFWFVGSMMVTQFPNLSKNVLAATESIVTLLLVVFSIGIGVGSLLCERLSGHKVEIGLVPFGSIGITVFGIDLFFATSLQADHPPLGLEAFLQAPAHWRILADLALIGLFGGFFVVPLYALVQSRSEPAHRSRVIARIGLAVGEPVPAHGASSRQSIRDRSCRATTWRCAFASPTRCSADGATRRPRTDASS